MSEGCLSQIEASPSDQLADSDGVVIRPIGLDDWGDVRYVHATAFRTLVGPEVSDVHRDAFNRQIAAPDYVQALLAADLFGAWLHGELVGTAGWRPGAGGARVAQIVGLFVRPLFTGMGIGSRLLIEAEARARTAGYRVFTTYATAASLPFFEINGYDIAGYERFALAGPGDGPAILMRKSDADAPEAVAHHPAAVPSPLTGDDAALLRALQRTFDSVAPRPVPGAGLLFGAIPPREPSGSG